MDLGSFTLKIYLLKKIGFPVFSVSFPCNHVPYSLLLYSLPKTKFSVGVVQGKWRNKKKYNITE